MLIECYLYVDHNGNFRVRKSHAIPMPSEIGIKLKLEIDNRFFKRPMPEASIKIPDYLITDLKLEVAEVQDGLLELLKKKKDKLENEK